MTLRQCESQAEILSQKTNKQFLQCAFLLSRAIKAG